MIESYKSTSILIDDARDAFDTIERLSNCDCPDPLPRSRFCIHFHFTTAIRDLLIDRDATADEPSDAIPASFTAPDFIYDFARALLAMIDRAPYQTHKLSMLALDHSLCPMHFCDYAICFDDDDPECAAIRACFDSHDT